MIPFATALLPTLSGAWPGPERSGIRQRSSGSRNPARIRGVARADLESEPEARDDAGSADRGRPGGGRPGIGRSGRAARAEGSTAIAASRLEGSDPSDREAVDGARRGDPESFRVLVERYQGRAYRLALRVLRDEERARDAVQDAFLKAYVNLDRFEGRSSFYTWLYRLVMNLCLDARRRDRSSRIVAIPESMDLEQLGAPDSRPVDEQVFRAHEQDPEQALGREQLRTALAQAIADLPDAARETLILREVEGLSYAEIAAALEIPKGTVMSRLHYARRRVQELLRQGEKRVRTTAPDSDRGGSR